MLKRKMPALRQLGVEVERTEERTPTSPKVAFVHYTRKLVAAPPDAAPSESEAHMTNGVNGTGAGVHDDSPSLDDV
jgi:hypothetical protein